MTPGRRGEVIEQWLRNNPGLDDRTMSVVGCFKLIHEALERASESACEQQQLSPAELEVLVPLRHSDEQVTGAKLARDLGMTRASQASRATGATAAICHSGRSAIRVSSSHAPRGARCGSGLWFGTR